MAEGDEGVPMDATGGFGGEAPAEIDLQQIRVEALMLQVASELMSIGAGHLGMIPGMVNGGDAIQASLAIGGADALIEAFVEGVPPGTQMPPQVDELRRAVAELKLAFAEAVQMTADAAVAEADGASPAATSSPAAAPPPPAAPSRPEPPRPKIWTPGGEV